MTISDEIYSSLLTVYTNIAFPSDGGSGRANKVLKEIFDSRQRRLLKMRAVANHYGKPHQLEKLQEECGELWGAVHEYVKSEYEAPKREHMIEEMADVLVMAEQIMYLENIADEVEKVAKEKINRQIKRIEEENENEQ